MNSILENLDVSLIWLCLGSPFWGGCLLVGYFCLSMTRPGDRKLLLKGKIIDVKKERVKSSTNYHMVYEYEYEGQIYQKTSMTPAWVGNYAEALDKVGKEVKIYINPADPENYFCPEDEKMSKLLGILFLCLGVIVVFITFM